MNSKSQFRARHGCKVFAGGFGKKSVVEYVEPNPTSLCQCGSSSMYKDCCLPVHESGGSKDPLKVVKSRFSALKYGIIEHMIKTTDPSHKDYVPEEKTTKYKKYFKDIQKYSTEFDFHELKFEEASPVEFDNENLKAYVSFTVKLERKVEGRKAEILRERSTFKRNSNDFWLYVEGEVKGMKSSTENDSRMVDMSKVNQDGKNSAIALGTQMKK